MILTVSTSGERTVVQGIGLGILFAWYSGVVRAAHGYGNRLKYDIGVSVFVWGGGEVEDSALRSSSPALTYIAWKTLAVQFHRIPL